MKSRALVAVAAIAAMGLTAASAEAATMNVNTVEDGFDEDGKCALREAVEAARLNKKEDGCPKGEAKRDKINLKGVDYQLSFVSSNENSNQNGDFDFTGGGPVTVAGKGSDVTQVSQNADDRAFDVAANGNVTLQNLTVRNGDVTEFDVAEARGGNIRVTDGSLRLKNVDVSGGDAYVGGGLYANTSASARLTGGFWSTNAATAAGGALGVQADSSATVKRVLFQQNDALSTTQSVTGGTIYSSGADVSLIQSQIQASTAEASGAAHAASGGSIFSNGDLVVDRSTIRGGSTSATTDNVAEHGGAIYVAGGDARIVNSLLFDNLAGIPGDNDGLGAGVYSQSGDTIIQFTTLQANDASSAGDAVGEVGGSIALLGSLIEDETDGCYGSITSLGHNQSETTDANCGFGGSDLPNADNNLATPAENGGFSETAGLNPGSDAIDFVPKGVCKGPTSSVDQRGFVRPNVKQGVKQNCDAGSFEVKAKPK